MVSSCQLAADVERFKLIRKPATQCCAAVCYPRIGVTENSCKRRYATRVTFQKNPAPSMEPPRHIIEHGNLTFGTCKEIPQWHQLLLIQNLDDERLREWCSWSIPSIVIVAIIFSVSLIYLSPNRAKIS